MYYLKNLNLVIVVVAVVGVVVQFEMLMVDLMMCLVRLSLWVI
jgi:hypothetical protein